MNPEINKAAREAAEAAFEIAVEGVPEEGADRYWEVLHFHVAKKAKLVGPEDPKSIGMTDQQAKLFERGTMPFGKHEGRRIGVVADEDEGYLHYIVEPDTFKADLVRYLRSDYFRTMGS